MSGRHSNAPALHPWNTDFVWQNVNAEPQTLSREQVAAFDRDGWFLVNQLVEPDLLARLRTELDQIEAATEANLRTRDGERSLIAEADAIVFSPHVVVQSSAARELATSAVVAGIARDLLGPDVRLYWDQLVYKKPTKPRRFPWHQDNGYTFVEPQQYLTIWVALTDAVVENGCPWVAPGLHRHGTLAHEWVDPLGFECLTDSDEAVAAEVQAGGAVVFSSLTPHMTGPNLQTEVRRTYILQYAPTGAIAHFGDAGHEPAASIEAADPQRQFEVVRSGELLVLDDPAAD